ncbi:hypothetical protein AB4099_08820 [Bosea sp. 2KB_26]|uniref:hypothetical protein n=1 Tax=Bosea sp. 2KB_26 TaxID=3237475 RepID=UPI003F91E7E0
MQIECFSLGKRFATPEENEDSVVILPGRGYAVIDGVTDRSGRRFGTMRAGRFASARVATEVARFLLSEDLSVRGGDARVRRLVLALSDTLRDGYAAHGMSERVETDATTRIGCTLALGYHDGSALQLVSIGDSGIRLSGKTLGTVRHVEAKPLDRVTALIRRECWAYLGRMRADPLHQRAISDDAVWNGLRVPPAGLSAEASAEVRAHVLHLCSEEMPTIARTEIERLLDSGISGQRVFANHPTSDLGYGVLDGFAIAERHVFTADYAADEVSRLELFSDGYFAEPEAFGVAAWEASFAEVERIDPDKIGPHASVKGSGPDGWTDDRTYLGIAFDR